MATAMLGLGIRRAVGACRASGWASVAAGRCLARGVSGPAAGDRDMRVEYLENEFSGAIMILYRVHSSTHLIRLG